MGERVTVTAATGSIWERTTQLRWARPAETTTLSDRLQIAWRCMETGEIDWEDVPVVVLPPLKSQEPT